MRIDVHVHLFPPDIVPKIRQYTDKDPFLELICFSPKQKYAAVEDLLEVMERDGIDKAAICGFASRDEGLCRVMNDYILEAARQFPARLIAMTAVNPLSSGMEKEIRRCHEQGAAGVGELFPWGQMFALDGSEADKLASVCGERNLPLLLHVNENVGHYYPGKGDVSVREAAEYAGRHPELKLIYAHWGGGLLFYELMPELKEQMQNVYYDTAAGPFLYGKNIYRVAREIGIIHKILLGTDYPLIPPRRYLRGLQEAGLAPEESALIEGENARRLFFGVSET